MITVIAAGSVRSPAGACCCEGGGNLLQEDDRRDAQGEALDHRPRDERHGPAEAGGSRRQHQPGLPPPSPVRDAAESVLRDDRREDHRHRPRRAGHLHMRTAEHGRDQARDHRR